MRQDVSPIDVYTLVHFLYGYVAKRYGYSNEAILVGAVLYEMIEPRIIDYMRNTLKMDAWGHESKHNILWDILIAEFGAYTADYDMGNL